MSCRVSGGKRSLASELQSNIDRRIARALIARSLNVAQMRFADISRGCAEFYNFCAEARSLFKITCRRIAKWDARPMSIRFYGIRINQAGQKFRRSSRGAGMAAKS